MILCMYTDPWQGLTIPWGPNFDVNRNVLSIRSFIASLYIYIAPGHGQTDPRRQNFDVNRKALSLYPFVASFKEISLKSDFIHFCFMI